MHKHQSNYPFRNQFHLLLLQLLSLHLFLPLFNILPQLLLK
jgi:hypothetical protein